MQLTVQKYLSARLLSVERPPMSTIDVTEEAVF